MLRLPGAGLLMAGLLASPRAEAQMAGRVEAPPAASSAQPPASQPPVVTMPVVKKNEGAVYPKQAIDEGFLETVDVPLLLDVGPTGAVTKAVVEKPAGHGLDEAATEAARALEFEPATRDGKPIAVRIRFSYHLAPPPAALSGRVVTLAGEHPIAGATVIVRSAAGTEQTLATDANGAWHLDGLEAGDYHVTVRAPGRTAHEADVTVKLAEEVATVDRLELEAAAVAKPALSGSDDVTEVEVKGQKAPRSVTVRTLEQREISRIPGTNGDALKSLQNLPGVGRPPGFAGLLLLRGSAPQDSQVMIDGTPVPLLYHFGGLSSVIPTEMIERIDFYPGNFSSQYGRVTGGVVDVGLLDPTKDKVHGLVQVDLIDSRLVVQGPIFDTGWRFAVAARRSYIDTWLGPVLKALGEGVSVSPVYYDYQAVLEKDLTPRSSLRFAFFGSDDKLDILNTNASSGDPELSGALQSHTGFWRGQVQYKNRFSDSTEFRANVAFGQDSVSFSAGNLLFDLVDYPITGRLELSQKLEKWLTMNVGFDMLDAPYTATAHLPPFPKPGQAPSGPFAAQTILETHATGSVYQPATYVEWEATPWRGARIVPGVRLDYTKNTGSWDVDPRVAIRQDITRSPRTTLKGAVGLFSQPPSPQQTNAVFGTPGLVDQRALMYDLGIEREVTSNIDASLDGFYKQLDYFVNQGVGSTASGVIYGAEVLIRYKPDAHFFGWLSYTLSRSMERDAPGMPLRLSQFDETHLLTVLGSYRLGRGWEFGARYRLTSGYMYTPQTYGFYDENVGTYVSQQAYPPFGSRLPLFQSLDMRVDKIWRFTNWSFGMYLDVLNVFNSGNVDGLSYNFNSTKSSTIGDLPFLPSFGIHADF